MQSLHRLNLQTRHSVLYSVKMPPRTIISDILLKQRRPSIQIMRSVGLTEYEDPKKCQMSPQQDMSQ
jgi:hypothetical protein